MYSISSDLYHQLLSFTKYFSIRLTTINPIRVMNCINYFKEVYRLNFFFVICSKYRHYKIFLILSVAITIRNKLSCRMPGTRVQWSEKDLRSALQDIPNRMSIKSVVKQYYIPRSTQGVNHRTQNPKKNLEGHQYYLQDKKMTLSQEFTD